MTIQFRTLTGPAPRAGRPSKRLIGSSRSKSMWALGLLVAIATGSAGAVPHVIADIGTDRVHDVLRDGERIHTALQADASGVLIFEGAGPGSYQIVDAGAGDTVPPADVVDLAVTGVDGTAVTVAWTAPGDDGTQGTASGYEIRWARSASEIGTTPNRDPNPPAPAPAGTRQQHVLRGLPAETTVFIALRARDNAGLWSGLSNVVQATTAGAPPQDVTPPAAVSDLEVLDVEPDPQPGIRLSWTATGDDGTSGQASSYEFRYAEIPITSANFDDFSEVSALALSAPRPPGSPEIVFVASPPLLPSTRYYFAVVVVDDAGNRSTVSNVVNATTLAGEAAPMLPPGAPAANFDGLSVVLEWEPSPSASGYFVYRRRETGSPESRLTDEPVRVNRYVDSSVIDGVAYIYRVTAVREDQGTLNESPHSAETWIRATTGAPAAITFDRVYPNPIRGRAIFRFGIPEVGPGHPEGIEVTLDLYDVAGRRVSRVVEGRFQPGIREVAWNPSSSGSPIMPGIYVGVLRAGSRQIQQRIAIAR